MFVASGLFPTVVLFNCACACLSITRVKLELFYIRCFIVAGLVIVALSIMFVSVIVCACCSCMFLTLRVWFCQRVFAPIWCQLSITASLASAYVEGGKRNASLSLFRKLLRVRRVNFVVCFGRCFNACVSLTMPALPLSRLLTAVSSMRMTRFVFYCS